MNTQKDWKAKLERAYSFMLEYSKITVCRYMPHSKLLPYLHKSHWGIVTEKGIRVIHHTKMKGNWLFFYVTYTHMASHFLVKNNMYRKLTLLKTSVEYSIYNLNTSFSL